MTRVLADCDSVRSDFDRRWNPAYRNVASNQNSRVGRCHLSWTIIDRNSNKVL